MDATTIFVTIGLVFGFYMAWNIGANDVANAMGTSVGSGALGLRQAILAAAVFEFLGAVLVGSHVTETVKKGIVHVDAIPDVTIFMAVMVSSLLAAGIWLQLATWKGWPVSTTHSIVGAVAGGGIAAAGFGGVNWPKLGFIAVSWVLSPVIGAMIAFFLFRAISRGILASHTPRVMVRRWSPLLVAMVVEILFLSMLYKGLKNLHLDLPFGRALAWATVLALVAALATALRFWSRRSARNRRGSPFGYVERQFRWLQVVTACYVAFAHGANDVANAIGPVAGAWSAWSSGSMAGKVPVPTWILVMGGGGIVVGLATWGYRVMETIGRKITELTPSRGFSAEFAAATTVLVCSKLGLPISTTHTLVGSVIGVGLARGIAALDLRVVRHIFAAWVITLPVSFVFSAALLVVIRLFL